MNRIQGEPGNKWFGGHGGVDYLDECTKADLLFRCVKISSSNAYP